MCEKSANNLRLLHAKVPGVGVCVGWAEEEARTVHSTPAWAFSLLWSSFLILKQSNLVEWINWADLPLYNRSIKISNHQRHDRGEKTGEKAAHLLEQWKRSKVLKWICGSYIMQNQNQKELN